MSDGAQRDNLKVERDRFVAFAFAAADLLIQVDGDGIVRFASGAAMGMTRRRLDALVGTSFIDLLSPSDRAFARTLLQELTPGARLEPVLVRLSRERTSDSVVQLGACRLPGDGSQYQVTLSTVRGGTDADALASADPVTGLLDSESFQSVAQARIEAAAEAGQDVKMTLLELNGVPEDMPETVPMMAEIGAYLRAHSIGGMSAGRLDAEKYGVLHGNGVDSEVLKEQIGRIARDNAPAGVAIAVASATLDLTSGDLPAADAGKALAFALNSFITSAGDGFSLDQLARNVSNLMSQTVDRMSALRKQIDERRFSIVFQPIVGLTDRKAHHFEVLARFTDTADTGGTIAFAEQVHMVKELDLEIARQSVERLRQRIGDGMPVELAVNLSARSLESEAFVKELFDLLLPTSDGVRRHLLFEVTESSEITRMEQVHNVITRLRGLDLRVCLDDFGQGAASFQYIQAFDVDFVKIDGAYVRRALDQPKDRAIVRAMIGLCRDLGVGTIAEMIETEEQAAALIELGAGFGQGYLFGRPAEEPVAPAPPKPAQKRKIVGARKA
jgi:EAL domain-containing protein (putative c-di-GMP-specific phosphodiesterase class I)/PAS domain-containing protein